MTNQTLATPSVKKISELYQMIKSGELILQPEFQRKFVWNRRHQENFIETILKGFPFPEIYIAQTGIDLKTIKTQQVVVDGQQRISTIVKYIDELESFSKKIPKFSELEPKIKQDFLGYHVTVRDLGDIDEKRIKEVFKRINLTQYRLNQIEIHHAVYDGAFIKTAQKILDKNENFNVIFSGTEILRMQDLYFITLLMSIVENGSYFTGFKEIEKFIIDFNDDYKQSSEIISNFNYIFNIIKKVKLNPDSMWLKKTNFLTLFIELYKRLDHIDVVDLRTKLNKFEENVLKNKNLGDKNDFGLYYSFMYTGTTSRKARITRADIFNKYI